MSRTLQLLRPQQPGAAARRTRSSATMLFWLAVFALGLQILLPYIVLDAIGINTQKIKFHPATLLAIVGGTYALFAGAVPFHTWSRRAPGLVLFVFAIPVLCAYSIYFTGFSGSAVFIETFWAAGLLAVMLETATPRQRRLLGSLLIAACLFNCLVGLVESITQQNWFPLMIDPDAPKTEVTEDFRAHAFYNHPLSASLVTTLGIFLLYAMRLPLVMAGPIFSVLLIGLLAFGGRAALGVTLGISGITAIVTLFTGIVRRNLKLDFVMALLIAAVAIPLLVVVIVTQTTIADRIIDNLYYDSSAEVRATQWDVFRYLSLQNWLFGIPQDDLRALKYQIGLGGPYTDIENPWILLMLDLGLIGFLVFAATLGSFLVHLGRYARNQYGWLLILSAFVIDSGSNSLGVKTSDLFLEVAFLVAVSGYTDYQRMPRAARSRASIRHAAAKRPATALGPVMPQAKGLRLLRSKTS